MPPRRLRVARCPAADIEIEPEWHAKGRGEISRALTGRRPKLAAYLDLHEVLQCHTDTSAPRTLQTIRLVCDHREPSMPT
ncbi:hypothetical protein JQ574_15630 [Bradyrhizobium sp. AUGA SZCCT0158]|nr:hypothetical protein [Bradyrhizobium sp. AUGA SZCCT0158]